MIVADILSLKGTTLFTVNPDMMLSDAVLTMDEHDIGSVPVMDDGVLMGILSFHDVARSVLEAQSFENRMLKAYIRDWPQDENNTQGGGL